MENQKYSVEVTLHTGAKLRIESEGLDDKDAINNALADLSLMVKNTTSTK